MTTSTAFPGRVPFGDHSNKENIILGTHCRKVAPLDPKMAARKRPRYAAPPPFCHSISQEKKDADNEQVRRELTLLVTLYVYYLLLLIVFPDI